MLSTELQKVSFIRYDTINFYEYEGFGGREQFYYGELIQQMDYDNMGE